MKYRELLTSEAKAAFLPCKTCSNILTEKCLNDCIYNGDFKHYKQRPGTDIKELPPFPLEDVLDYPDARFRLMAIGIYLKAIVDYLQHMEEYAKNREYYRKNGHKSEDYSI